MTERLSPAENDSAVSSRSDRHKIRCFGHRSSTPSDRQLVDAQSKIRAVLRSACKTADRAGTRCGPPATRSTSDPDSQIVSTQRPFEQYRSGNQSLHTARAPADSLTTDQQSESPDRLLKNKLSLSAPSSALTPPRLQKPRKLSGLRLSYQLLAISYQPSSNSGPRRRGGARPGRWGWSRCVCWGRRGGRC